MFGYSLEDERAFHKSVARAMIACSFITFALLHFVIRSPFGKHAPQKTDKSKWFLGPLLPARISWFVFEIQNIMWVFISLSQPAEKGLSPINALLLSLFVIHYVNRAIVYPLMMSKSQPMPLLVVLCAFLFCTCNG